MVPGIGRFPLAGISPDLIGRVSFLGKKIDQIVSGTGFQGMADT